MAQAPPRSIRSENPPHPQNAVGGTLATPKTWMQVHYPINFDFTAALYWSLAVVLAIAVAVLIRSRHLLAGILGGLLAWGAYVLALIESHLPMAQVVPLAVVGVVVIVGEIAAIHNASSQYKRDMTGMRARLDRLTTAQRVENLRLLFKMQEDILGLARPYRVAEALSRGDLRPEAEPTHIRQMDEARMTAIGRFNDEYETNLRFLLISLSHDEVAIDPELDILLASGVSSIEDIEAIAAAMNRTINRAGGHE